MEKFNNLHALPPWPLLSLIVCLLLGTAASEWIKHIDQADAIQASPNLRRISATVVDLRSSEHSVPSPAALDPSEIRETHYHIDFRFEDLNGKPRAYSRTLISRPGTHSQAQQALEKTLARARNGSVDIYLHEHDPGYLEWAFRIDRKLRPNQDEQRQDDNTRWLLSITLGLMLYLIYGIAAYLKRELFSAPDRHRLN